MDFSRRRHHGGGVKLVWFHLMPYPDLPEDFNKKHRSVWVDIDPALFDPDVIAEAYDTYIDQLVYAEECGFDGLGINEHHANGYGLMPSPNLFGSVIASRTSRAAITLLGNSVALYNPPVRVAEEMAVLDLMSRGRIIAGFPVGTSMDTAYAYSANPGTLHREVRRGDRPDQTGLDRARALRLQRTLHPDAHRERGPEADAATPPADLDPRRRVGRDLGLLRAERLRVRRALVLRAPARRENVGNYWRRVEENGKDPNPHRLAFVQFIGVGDTDAEAYKLYREPAEYFFNRSLHVYAGYADPPGYVTEASVRARYKSAVRQVARSKQQKHDLTWDEMVEKGYVVIGSPDTVRETLEEVAKTFNCGHLLTALHFGNMSDELTRYNTKLFGDKVAPALRGIFADVDDPWWPKNATGV